MIASSMNSSGNTPSSGIPVGMKTDGHAPSKILIVDDEPDILDEVSECLGDEGFEWVAAHNADEASNLVESDTDIGIVVTDIRMPGTDGLELSRSLLKKYGADRDIFIIVVTGHAGMREAIEALQIGAEDFLTKPISPDHLLHSIKRAEEMIHLRYSERAFKQRLETEVKERTADVKKLAVDLEDRNRELEEMNRQLVDLGRLKDEFLMMMSHELNTPMNAIYGFAQLLDQSEVINGKDDLKMFVGSILSGSERLMKTVSSILLLSDLTAGRIELSHSTFSSEELLNSADNDFPSYTYGTESRLTCHHPDKPFEMEVDHYYLMKAINVLMDNGIKFGGGDMTIEVSEDENFAHISLSDKGPGMSDEQIAIALEPMRQVDGSAERNIEGVGLGLTLVKGIAEAHGGQLSLNSKPGEGTTATISVPKKRTESAT